MRENDTTAGTTSDVTLKSLGRLSVMLFVARISIYYCEY